MPLEKADMLAEIKSWLSTSHGKIQSFWIGADWRAWARFELFMTLEQNLGSDYLITHSNDDFWVGDTELIDILIEPRDEARPIAIILRCERVNENEGSFERFVEQYEEDWARLQEKGDVENEFEGTRVLLLGFSGEAVGDGIDTFKLEPKPEHFRLGEVYGWARTYEVPKSS